MVLVSSQPSCKYLANAMSPSVNLTATGRWFKGMKGAAASSLKNMTNKGVAWRGVSDTLLTVNGILKRSSSVWRQLFHCLVFRVGEMAELTHGVRHNPQGQVWLHELYLANTCVLCVGVVMVIRRNTYFICGFSVFMLEELGGVLHTGKYTKFTLFLVSVIRGTSEINENRVKFCTKWFFSDKTIEFVSLYLSFFSGFFYIVCFCFRHCLFASTT